MAEADKSTKKTSKTAEKAPVKSLDVDPVQELQETKVIAALAYLGILFFVPLLAKPDSEFAKFHANQGLVLFIAGVAVSMIMWIPFFGWLFGFAGWVAVVVLAIMGIINALNGKMEKLPLLGDIELIK